MNLTPRRTPRGWRIRGDAFHRHVCDHGRGLLGAELRVRPLWEFDRNCVHPMLISDHERDGEREESRSAALTFKFEVSPPRAHAGERLGRLAALEIKVNSPIYSPNCLKTHKIIPCDARHTRRVTAIIVPSAPIE